MGALSPHIVSLEEQVVRQRTLNADVPLLNGRVGRVLGDRTNAYAVQIEFRRIEEVARKAVPQQEQRRCGRGRNGRCVVDQEGRIQRELILTAVAFERLVEDAVSRSQNCFAGQLVSQTGTRSKILAIHRYQRSILQGSVLGGQERASVGGAEVREMILAFDGR